jgi:hypothetical protein
MAVRPGYRAVIGTLGPALLTLALGLSCAPSSSSTTGPAAPSVDDALRTAKASRDQIMNAEAAGTTLGPIEQHAYACAGPDPCLPREGFVARDVTHPALSRSQVTVLYLRQLAAAGWSLVEVHCDEARNEYVVLATKAPSATASYPGRFELLTGTGRMRLRITVPAIGAESQFRPRPEGANYPEGACRDQVKAAAALSRPNTDPTDTGSTATVGTVAGG